MTSKDTVSMSSSVVQPVEHDGPHLLTATGRDVPSFVHGMWSPSSRSKSRVFNGGLSTLGMYFCSIRPPALSDVDSGSPDLRKPAPRTRFRHISFMRNALTA